MQKRRLALNLVAAGLVVVLTIVIVVVMIPRGGSASGDAHTETPPETHTPDVTHEIVVTPTSVATDGPPTATTLRTSPMGDPLITPTLEPTWFASPIPDSVLALNTLEKVFDLPGFDQFWDFSPDGQWMLISNRTTSDLRTLHLVKADGTERIELLGQAGWYHYADWSPDGQRIVLAALASETEMTYEIYTVNLDDPVLMQRTDNPANDMAPVWSPDSSKIAFVSERGGGPDLYVMMPDDATIRLTSGMGVTGTPAWSPDGAQIAFIGQATSRTGGVQTTLYLIDVDGTNLRAIDIVAVDSLVSWSPDGSALVYTKRGPALDNANPLSYSDVWIVNLDSLEKTQLTTDPAEDMAAVWSPDGQYIAFMSNREGKYNFWVIRPDGTDLQQFPNPGRWDARYPRWSPDSQFLYTDNSIPYAGSTISNEDAESDIYRAYLADFVPVDMIP